MRKGGKTLFRCFTHEERSPLQILWTLTLENYKNIEVLVVDAEINHNLLFSPTYLVFIVLSTYLKRVLLFYLGRLVGPGRSRPSDLPVGDLVNPRTPLTTQ